MFNCLMTVPARVSPNPVRINEFIPKKDKRYLQFNVNAKVRLPRLILPLNVYQGQNCFQNPNYPSQKKTFSLRCYRNDAGDSIENSRSWISFISSIMPGGSWWNLHRAEEVNYKFPTAAKPISVWHALRTMWLLVADEAWVLYIAFGSLTIAAVSLFLSKFSRSSISLLGSCLWSL